MPHTRDVVEGLAALLDASGLGVYRPNDVYDPDEVAIVFTAPPDQPDRVICLTPYPVEDSDTGDVIEAVQIRIRVPDDPNGLGDIADGIRDALHNRRGLLLGSVRVALIWRQSQAPMGQDERGRPELAANYYYRATRPGPHLYE